MPLRPSRLTTSPAFTAKETPKSTWDAPYPAWRPATSSMAAVLRCLLLAEIGGADFGLARISAGVPVAMMRP